VFILFPFRLSLSPLPHALIFSFLDLPPSFLPISTTHPFPLFFIKGLALSSPDLMRLVLDKLCVSFVFLRTVMPSVFQGFPLSYFITFCATTRRRVLIDFSPSRCLSYSLLVEYVFCPRFFSVCRNPLKFCSYFLDEPFRLASRGVTPSPFPERRGWSSCFFYLCNSGAPFFLRFILFNIASSSLQPRPTFFFWILDNSRCIPFLA